MKTGRLLKCFVFTLMVFCIYIIGLNDSGVRASNLPVQYVSGTITANQTWNVGTVYVVNNTLTIPSGVTLTISPGAIIKYELTWFNKGILLNGGTVDAQGTSSQPVNFTSIKDDSIGGDSGLDGDTAGTPGDYPSALGGSGTAIIRYANIKFSDDTLNYQCQHGSFLVLSDNNIDSTVNISNCLNGQVVMERNNFALQNSGQALSLTSTEVSDVTLKGVNKNNFFGVGASRTISLSDSFIDAGNSWEVDPSSGATLHVKSLTTHGTLTLYPGMVIKMSNHWTNKGIRVNPGGLLTVAGSPSSKVTFTSIKDDTVAGDSMGDGVTTGAPGDYPMAITNSGGVLVFSHAEVRYAEEGIFTQCSGTGSSTLSDSLFRSTVRFYDCQLGTVTMQNNDFHVQQGYALAIDSTDVTGISMEGSNQNVFTGTNQTRVIYWANSTIPSNATWKIGSIDAIFQVSSIVIKGTLDIQSGVFKGASSWRNNGLTVESGGRLTVTGALEAPVLFTSIKDDSLGGDSSGDGSTAPSQNDYPVAVRVNTGGIATIVHAKVRYAGDAFQVFGGSLQARHLQISDISTVLYTSAGETNFHGSVVNAAYNGFQVEGTAQAIIRGSITGVGNRAVVACKWEQLCNVDATYMDWGTQSGPFSGNGDMVCGKVSVSPWVYGSSTQTGSVFQTKNCQSSMSPNHQLQDSIQAYESRISPKKIDCSYGIQDACAQANRMIACVEAAASLALYNSPFPAPNSSPSEAAQTYAQDLSSGATIYLNTEADPSPTVFVTSFFDKLLSITSIWSGLSSAYYSCN